MHKDWQPQPAAAGAGPGGGCRTGAGRFAARQQPSARPQPARRRQPGRRQPARRVAAALRAQPPRQLCRHGAAALQLVVCSNPRVCSAGGRCACKRVLRLCRKLSTKQADTVCPCLNSSRWLCLPDVAAASCPRRYMGSYRIQHRAARPWVCGQRLRPGRGRAQHSHAHALRWAAGAATATQRRRARQRRLQATLP